MGSKTRFDTHLTSDQKRLVRGEHLLASRTILRQRDGLGVHHRAWRVLMLAGGDPRGELTAIRELMPRAHIVALDMDPENVERARAAGADEGIVGNLADFSETPLRSGGSRSGVARCLLDQAPFDIVDMDFCGSVTNEMREVLRFNRKIIRKGGVLLLTFSYGREVVEVFEMWTRVIGRHHPLWSLAKNPPTRLLAGRLAFLGSPGFRPVNIASILLYRGAHMPMCSVLVTPERVGTWGGGIQINSGDFELAVCYPESARLYDCPADRIAAFRRRHAALRAALTRASSHDRSLDTGPSVEPEDA